jgi:hypothetical protein
MTRHYIERIAMKMKLLGLTTAMIAIFATAAAAATRLAATGCCPLCK